MSGWLLLGVLTACAPRGAPPATSVDPATVTHTDDDTLAASVGRRVVLVGRADDAKLGAVVVVGDTPVWLAGHDAWPDGWRGANVRVAGRLDRRALAPEPEVGPNGERSAGMVGDAWVIDDAVPEREP